MKAKKVTVCNVETYNRPDFGRVFRGIVAIGSGKSIKDFYFSTEVWLPCPGAEFVKWLRVLADKLEAEFNMRTGKHT